MTFLASYNFIIDFKANFIQVRHATSVHDIRGKEYTGSGTHTEDKQVENNILYMGTFCYYSFVIIFDFYYLSSETIERQ